MGEKPLLLERSSVAAAASGKAGGFLAREWGSGVTVQLHQKSFDLHRELAAELGLESFRMVDTLSADGSRKGKSVATWLDGQVASAPMDSVTAQVTPSELTHKLVNAALSRGAELRIGTVNGVRIEDGRVTGVSLADGELIAADKLVLCAGPWYTYISYS